MNRFDELVIGFINSFSRQSLVFDKTVVSVLTLDLLKGGLVIGLFWGLWFGITSAARQQDVRERIISSLVGCFAALLTARILALTLPFRYRPMHNPDIDFTIPHEMHTRALEGWSSFPSDHGVLFLTLAFSLFIIARPLGLFAIIYVSAMILFPRIYTGLHYPTDILVGVPLGLGFAWCFNLHATRTRVGRPLLKVSQKAPGFFYFGFFILSFIIATLFNDVRSIAEKSFKLIFVHLLDII